MDIFKNLAAGLKSAGAALAADVETGAKAVATEVEADLGLASNVEPGSTLADTSMPLMNVQTDPPPQADPDAPQAQFAPLPGGTLVDLASIPPPPAPVDNDHVAPGCELFTSAEAIANAVPPDATPGVAPPDPGAKHEPGDPVPAAEKLVVTPVAYSMAAAGVVDGKNTLEYTVASMARFFDLDPAVVRIELAPHVARITAARARAKPKHAHGFDASPRINCEMCGKSFTVEDPYLPSKCGWPVTEDNIDCCVNDVAPRINGADGRQTIEEVEAAEAEGAEARAAAKADAEVRENERIRGLCPVPSDAKDHAGLVMVIVKGDSETRTVVVCGDVEVPRGFAVMVPQYVADELGDLHLLA